MGAPRVSVVMSSYNHAPFVGQAIESVRAQTLGDFEFIIGDDGSSDGTAAVIRSFSDPRIVFTAHGRNRGAAAVTNESLQRCRGEYVARINSDDFWPPTKLAEQVSFLDAHPEYAAMFGDARFVDVSGAPLADRPYQFAPPNTTRGGWLRRFFEEGNCLCHPTVLIRRSCFEELGGYDNRLRQLPDFDMWVRLVKRHPLFASDRVFTNFRIIPGANASTPSPENLVRHSAEHFLIAERFFDGADRELLSEGFADLIVSADLPSVIHCDIEKALMFFRPPRYAYLTPVYRVVGLRKLAELLASPAHRDVLQADYGIDDLAFQRLSATVDTFTTAFDGGAATPSIGDRLPTPAGVRSGAVATDHATRGSPGLLRVPEPYGSPATFGADSAVTGAAEHDTPAAQPSGNTGTALPPDADWQPILAEALAALDDDRLDQGRAACLTLLGDCGLPEAARELVYLAQTEFAQPLAELVPGAKRIELTWPAGEREVLRDPSPVVAGDRVLVLGRTVRSATEGHRTTCGGVLLTLDDDFAIADSMTLADETGIGGRFADLRPFVADGVLRATLTVYDPARDDWTRAGVVDIVDGAFRNPCLFGPRAGYFGQGWAPISTPDEPRFLAWWEPTEVLRLDHKTATFERETLRRASHAAERFWSGSQGVPVPGGILFLINETTVLADVEEVVTSRFVRLDQEFRLTGISPQFFITERGRDAATGLARRGNRLLAGFNSGEATATLLAMELAQVLATLVPIDAPGQSACHG